MTNDGKELAMAIMELYDDEFADLAKNEIEISGETQEERVYCFGLEMFARGLFTGMEIEKE